MIKQHIYRCGANGYHTAAVSSCMKNNAWLPLLEQQTAIHCADRLPAPVYFQYPLGRGFVLSRCLQDPRGQGGSFLAHQLVFDEPDDVDALMRVRPLPSSLFCSEYVEESDEPDPLPTLSAGALSDPEELISCFQAMDSLFAGDEWLLSRFLAALALTGRDKRQSVQAVVDDAPDRVSELGRRVMELTLRCLPADDALRVSYCTLQPSNEVSLPYSVCFSLPPPKSTSFFHAQLNIAFDFTARRMTLPQNVSLPEDEIYVELARALLAHDLNWVDRLRGGTASRAGIGVDSLHLEVPPFEAGMSIRQYFDNWQDELSLRRESLTDEAFRTLAADEWPRVLNGMVSASELMDMNRFLREMCGVLSSVLKEGAEDALALTDDVLADMIIILLDSVRWRQIDLFDSKENRLIRSVVSFATALTEEPDEPDCLTVGRIVHLLLTAPMETHVLFTDLSQLAERAPAQFDALQDCLCRYVEDRLSADVDLVDETLVAASMLAYARFTDGVPDLRLTDQLGKKIEAQSGAGAARRFRFLLDKMRHRLRADRPAAQRRRDTKLFLFISCALIALITGVTVWFFYLS